VEMVKGLTEAERETLRAKLARHNIVLTPPQEAVVIPKCLGMGVRVLTGPNALLRKHDREYESYARPLRKPNLKGTITDIDHGHGICYQVSYDIGGSAYFEPVELGILLDQSKPGGGTRER